MTTVASQTKKKLTTSTEFIAMSVNAFTPKVVIGVLGVASRKRDIGWKTPMLMTSIPPPLQKTAVSLRA
jgi:hypothetical protein